MKALLTPLQELADFKEIIREQKKSVGLLQVAGCVGSQKTHLACALGDGWTRRLVVYAGDEQAKQALEETRFLEENAFYYPARDLLFYHADIKGNYLKSQRMEVVRALLELPEIVVVTTVDAFLDGLKPLPEVVKERITLETGRPVDFTRLQKELAAIGYVREEQVEGPGQFAVRGGLLDVFPLTGEVPVRIELWGDEIDSIRSFEVESQRSIENLESVVIYPAEEDTGEEGKRVSFLDYFSPGECALYLDEPARLLERLAEVEDEYLSGRSGREEAGVEEDSKVTVFSAADVLAKLNSYHAVGFTTLENKCRGFDLRRTFSIHAQSVNPYNNSFETLTRDLKRLKRNGYHVVLLSGSRTRAKRLAEDLRDYDLSSFYGEDLEREVQAGEILVAYGHVAEGYEYPMLKFMVISETDIFGRRKKKRRRKRLYEGQKIQDFAELKVGDYVVHENHGLGVYEGIEQIKVDKVTKDYMKIRYADSGVLYI